MTGMARELFGVSTIRAGEVDLLLTSTGGGQTVHLSMAAEPGTVGRDAVPDHYRKLWGSNIGIRGTDVWIWLAA